MTRLRNAAIVLLTLAGLVGCDPGGGATVAPAPDEETAAEDGTPAGAGKKKGRRSQNTKSSTARLPNTTLAPD